MNTPKIKSVVKQHAIRITCIILIIGFLFVAKYLYIYL
jgi:hypothetical protein